MGGWEIRSPHVRKGRLNWLSGIICDSNTSPDSLFGYLTKKSRSFSSGTVYISIILAVRLRELIMMYSFSFTDSYMVILNIGDF